MMRGGGLGLGTRTRKTKEEETGQKSTEECARTEGQKETGERKEPQGRDLTLPSMGLIAPGKLSHGRAQAGQG